MVQWEMSKLARPLGLLIFLVAFFAAGYYARLVHEEKKPHHNQIRLQGYTFISPLVECETIHPTTSAHPDLRPLKTALKRIADSHIADGSAQEVALYFRDLRNGMAVGLNENAQFTPASLMKTPLMIALLKRAEHDPELLHKKIQYRGDDFSRFQAIRPDEMLLSKSWYTVDDLIARMIAFSDNNAALLLADHLGMQALAEVMEELRVPIESGPQGELITLRNYSSFFRILYNSSYLDDHHSERALMYLSRSTFDQGIRAGLPKDMLVASKFGEYSAGSYQLQEVGIIYYPDHPYLLGIVTKGGTRESLSHVMQELSGTIYAELNRQHKTDAHKAGI